jgi:hypothetical protein
MSLKPFNGIEPTEILAAIYRSGDQAASVHFRAKVPPHRTISANEQWLRVKLILGCSEVYAALGIQSLPMQLPAEFYYARGFEVIGTLANLLARGGVHRAFVDDQNQALAESRKYLDAALSEDYRSVEAYSCEAGWCEWFENQGVLDQTVLVGNRDDWWLLTVTGTD